MRPSGSNALCGRGLYFSTTMDAAQRRGAARHGAMLRCWARLDGRVVELRRDEVAGAGWDDARARREGVVAVRIGYDDGDTVCVYDPAAIVRVERVR